MSWREVNVDQHDAMVLIKNDLCSNVQFLTRRWRLLRSLILVKKDLKNLVLRFQVPPVLDFFAMTRTGVQGEPSDYANVDPLSFGQYKKTVF